jgi:hypothetical protein
VVAAQGDPGHAAALQRESLADWQTLGDAVGVSHSLDALAQVAAAGGQARRAARLFGAAAALRERTGGVGWPPWPDGRTQAEAAARAALGDTAFVAAWASGQALTLEEAAAEALTAAAVP